MWTLWQSLWIYFPEGTWLSFSLGRKLIASNPHSSKCLENVYCVQGSYALKFSSSPESPSWDLDAAWGSWWYSLWSHHRWHLVWHSTNQKKGKLRKVSFTNTFWYIGGRKAQSVWSPKNEQILVFKISCKVNNNYSLLRMVPSISAFHFQESHRGPTLNKRSSFSFPISETEKCLLIYVEISLIQGRYSSGRCLHQRPLTLGDASDFSSSLRQF